MFVRTITGFHEHPPGTFDGRGQRGDRLSPGEFWPRSMGKNGRAGLTLLIDLVMGIPHMLLLILSPLPGKGLLGRDPWHRTYPLGVSGQADPRGGFQLRERAVYPDRRENWEKESLSCVPSYGTIFCLVYHRADPHVPHAILHEASITFLGFGLSPEHRPSGSFCRKA